MAWILFGVVTAIAANARGCNAGVGLLLGFLGGPFALIGYLVAGKKSEKSGPATRPAATEVDVDQGIKK